MKRKAPEPKARQKRQAQCDLVSESVTNSEPIPNSKYKHIAKTYLALLRGVNVGGSGVLKMTDLANLFKATLKFNAVKTYIQTGNVVFQVPDGHSIEPDQLSTHLKEAIHTAFGLEVPVLIYSLERYEKVILENPFVGEKGLDEKRLHVTFFASSAEGISKKLSKLGTELKNEGITVDRDMFAVAGEGLEIYAYCPNGVANSKISNNFIERTLGVSATTRNWNTCKRLLQLLKE